MEFPPMTPFDVKLDFHPVARWVVNGDVVQAAQFRRGTTTIPVYPWRQATSRSHGKATLLPSLAT